MRLPEAIEALKKEPSHPDLVTEFWKSFFTDSLEKSGARIAPPEVPHCDWTQPKYVKS